MAATRIPLVRAEEADAGPPLFARIGVVGLGLIGGSIALAARRRWPSSLVIGVDRNDVLERAMVRHAMDVAADDLGILREAELVVLAAPVDENVRLLPTLPDVLPNAAIVTDVGSTKRDIVAAAAALPDRLAFVGGHPLAGAARGGIDFASPDLFRDRPWIVTPGVGPASAAPIAVPGGSGAATAAGPAARVAAFAAALGAVPHTMSAEAHDRLVAYLSHLPQLAASAVMQVIGAHVDGEGLALAGRGLLDTTRLASSPWRVWAGICRSNADEIGAALDALVAALHDLRAGLERPEVIARVFDAAAASRQALVDRSATRTGASAGQEE